VLLKDLVTYLVVVVVVVVVTGSKFGKPESDLFGSIDYYHSALYTRLQFARTVVIVGLYTM